MKLSELEKADIEIPAGVNEGSKFLSQGELAAQNGKRKSFKLSEIKAEAVPKKGMKLSEIGKPVQSDNELEDKLTARKQELAAQQEAAYAKEAEIAKQQEIQNQPENWSSSRFKEQTPKPQTPEEQAMYDATLAKKKLQEEQLKETLLPADLKKEKVEIKPSPEFLKIPGSESIADFFRGSSELFTRFLGGQLRGATLGATDALPANPITRQPIDDEAVKKAPELKKFQAAEQFGDVTGFMIPAAIVGSGLGAAGVIDAAANVFGTGSILGAVRQTMKNLGSGEVTSIPEIFKSVGDQAGTEALTFLAFEKGGEFSNRILPHLFKETKTTVEPLQKITLYPEDIQGFFKLGGDQTPVGQFLKSFGNLPEIFKAMRKTSSPYELIIPGRVIKTIQDRPWFSGFKEAFNLEPAVPKTTVEIKGEKAFGPVEGAKAEAAPKTAKKPLKLSEIPKTAQEGTPSEKPPINGGEVAKTPIGKDYERVITEKGGKFLGVTKGFKKKDGSVTPDLIQFRAPSGTTLALTSDKITPDLIRQKIDDAEKLIKSQKKEKLILNFEGKTYPIEKLGQASKMWNQVRDTAMKQGISAEELKEVPFITDASGKTIAHITWNGTIRKGPAIKEEIPPMQPISEAVGKSKANHVVVEIRGEDGHLTERIALPYDGTPEDAVKVSKNIQREMEGTLGTDPSVYSWQTSKIGITGKDGKLKWVMLNGKDTLIEPDTKTANLFYGKKEFGKKPVKLSQVEKKTFQKGQQEKARKGEVSRTAEDFELHPEKMKDLKKGYVAMKSGGKVYAEKIGSTVKGVKIYNHADLGEAHNVDFFKMIPGFVSKTGKFIEQYPKGNAEGITLGKKNPKTLYELPEGAITHEEAKNLLWDYKEGEHPAHAVAREMRKEIAEGQPGFRWVNQPGQTDGPEETIAGSEPSTFPDYFKDRGYTKSEALKVIDAFLENKPMTEKQKNLFKELFDAKIEHAKQEAKRYAEDERRAKEEAEASGVSSQEIAQESSTSSRDQERSPIQELIPGTEKPTYKKTEFGAPKTLPEQKTEALDLQKAATELKQKEIPIEKKLKAKLPPHLQEIVDKTKGITDVTPKGFGPQKGTFASYDTSNLDKYEKQIPETVKKSGFKLFEAFRALGKKYVSIIGERYIGAAGAMGTYKHSTDTVRTAALNAASVVIHEFAHGLDFNNKIVDTILKRVGTAKNGNPIYDPSTLKIRKEMTELYEKHYGLATKNAKLEKRMREGIATLLQKFVERPSFIKEKFPTLVKEFITPGGRFYQDVTTRFLNDVRGVIAKYQSLDPLYKIGAKVTTDPTQTGLGKDSFLNVVERLNTFWADNVYPISKLAAAAGKEMTAQDPALWIRAYNNSNALILNNIKGKRGYWTIKKDGFEKVHDFNWKNLVESIQKKGKVDDFGFWLVARDQHFQFKELDKKKEAAKSALKALKTYQEIAKQSGGMDVMAGDRTLQEAIEEAKATIKSYLEFRGVMQRNGFSREIVTKAYEDYREMFKDDAEMFDKLTREDLKLMASPEVGLITQKEFENYSKKEGYASLKRDIYDEVLGDEERLFQVRVGKTKVSSTMSRKGSELTIINPLYNGIRNHAEIVRKALKQIVYNKIGKLAPQLPGMIQQQPLKRAYDPKTKKTHYPQDKDPNILMSRDMSGKRVPYLVSSYIKKVIDELLEFRNIGLFEQLMTSFNRIFSKGTTGLYAPFTVTNFTIDQISAVAQTRNKYIPVYDALNQIIKALSDKNGEAAKFFEEYMVLGGEKQTFVGWQDMDPSELFKTIAGEKNGLVRALDLIVKGEDILALPSKYSEIITRATEYIKARHSGKSQVVALEEAGEVTAPFHHTGRLGGGTFGRTIIKSIPFFNPALQVFAKFIRTGANEKTRKRMAFTILAVTAALLGSQYFLFKKASQKQKDQYKDLQPEELAMNLYLPNPAGDNLIKIRIPQEYAGAATVINMALLNHYEDADYNVGDFIAAGTQFLPNQFNLTEPVKAFYSWIPQLLKPLLEVTANIRTFPKVLPLEGMAMKNRTPGQRFTEGTLPLPKWIGEKLGISPIKSQHLFLGYLGRVARPLLGEVPFTEKSNYNPLVKKYYFKYGRMIQKYYDIREQNQQILSDYNNERIELTDEQLGLAEERKGMLKEIKKAIKDYDEDESDEGREEILDLIRDLVKTEA